MLAGGRLLHRLGEVCLDDTLGRSGWAVPADLFSPGFQGTPDNMSENTGAFCDLSRCPDKQSI